MGKYWKSIEEKRGTAPTITEENPNNQLVENILSNELVNAPASRRDFLKWFGFSVTVATLASCEGPVQQAVPYVIKPDGVTLGVANHYASTFYDGSDYCSVLVKTRDGRPIKIKGNTLSPISAGGTRASVQASVLSLYDDARIKYPLNRGQRDEWKNMHSEIEANLKSISDAAGKIAFVTSPIVSPSTKILLDKFVATFPGTEIIYYSPISYAGILNANEVGFGKRIIPSYQLNNAKLIVGIAADFLGTWLSPVEFTTQYSKARSVDEKKQSMLRHIQYETGMTLTGSNADTRFPIKPSEEKVVVASIYNAIAKMAGENTVSGFGASFDVSDVAKELWENKGASVVMCGSNDSATQTLVNGINVMLGNYGTTLDIQNYMMLNQSDDDKMVAMVEELAKGKIKGLILNNVNPAYDYFQAEKFVNGIKRTDLAVCFTERMNETAALCSFVCNTDHYLESWDDAQPRKNDYSLTQPTIPKLFDTCSMPDCLLAWLGEEKDYYTFIKENWESTILMSTVPETTETIAVETPPVSSNLWVKTLQSGVFHLDTNTEEKLVFNKEKSLGAIANSKQNDPVEGLELALYQSLNIGNGKNANNPWLQELPDSLAKVSWDNFAAITPAYATENGIENGDFVLVNGIKLPALIQPGQANGTVSVALGYGRTAGGKVANGVGANFYPNVGFKNGTFTYNVAGITIETSGEKDEWFGLSQTHNSMEGREIVRETSLAAFLTNRTSGNEKHEEVEEEVVKMYPDQDFPGHHWGMSIDLNKCTGCGNCIVSCQAENNIAVIGKKEVHNRRLMHWIKLDRYYTGEEDNPGVVHLPVMCQQCDNAPCENVCPVSATMHSNEGINQMVYNRCIGTRYCMNNCPYKVRRFNWFQFVNNDKFDYNMNSDLGRMVLNPDVVVRTRGVAEKCSFCTQRIQEGKLKAKLEERQLLDGEISPACAQSCPAKAIVFGDLNDENSEVSKKMKSERNYHLLEEVHTLPSVGLLTKVRNC